MLVARCFSRINLFCFVWLGVLMPQVYAQVQLAPKQIIAQASVSSPVILGAPDVNNDGYPDILLTASGGWLWLANDGSGNFAPPQPIDPFPLPNYLLGDLNQDGFDDLVLATEDASGYATLTYQAGDGAGNFGTPQTIFTGAFLFTNIKDFQLADLNADGFLDILVAHYDEAWGGSFDLWLNDGAANFTYQSLPYLITCGMSFAAADFNNDGATDIAYALANNDFIAWQEQTAPLTFVTHHIINPSVSYPTDVFIADVDADGLPDVLSASGANGAIVWHKNLSGSAFAPPQTLLSAQNNDFCWEFAYDYNQNKIAYFGNLSGAGNAQLLYQHQNQAIFIPDLLTNPDNSTVIAASWHGATVVDIDNDGLLDIATNYDPWGTPEWYLNDGNGGFGFQNSFPDYGQPFFADMDNDGLVDMIARGAGAQLFWLSGATNFTTATALANIPIDFFFLGVSDVNNDGNTDIIGQLENAPFSLLWYAGDGMGNVGLPHIIAPSLNYYIQNTLQTLDLDNDGDTDLAAILPDEIAFWENQANGTFGSQQTLAALSSVSAYRFADIDNDGDLDLVVAISETDEIAWFPNVSGNPQISGMVFYDANQNGALDTDEFGLNFQNISVSPSITYVYTNANGAYTYFPPDANSYTLSFDTPQGWIATTPTTLTATTFIGQNSSDNNFGIYPISPVSEVNPYLSSGINRCELLTPYYLNIANEGTAIENLTLVTFQPDALLTFNYATPPPDSIGANGSIYWHINNLLPQSSQLIVAYLQAPDFTTAGAALQNTLHAAAFNELGEQTDTGSFAYFPLVTCAYDPNDKMVTPAGILEQHYTLMGEELFYTIRFQNTGNDTAFYVRITDVLSPYLNHQSFRIIGSSHPLQTYRYADGTVEFHFPNIMLPDSATDEPGSHGFVLFAITPLAGLPDVTPVTNTANIYFDANPPIATNTTLNTLVYELPTSPPLPISLLSFTGTIQPTNNLLQWTTASELNNAYFTLQASPDGRQFTTLAQLYGAGNSSAPRHYQYAHANPYPTTYYRLLQTDFDGVTRPAGEVIVLQRPQNNWFFALHLIAPNPTQNTATLTYTTPPAHAATLHLYDLTGRLLLQETLQPTGIGVNEYVLDLLPYPPGLYLVTLNNGTEVVSGKVVRE